MESSTFKRLDLAQAVRDELGTGNRLMPRRVDLLTLARALDEVAAWVGPQLKKGRGGGLADVVFADKGSRGARPLHVLTLEDRVLYRALLAALAGALPVHLTTRQSVDAFRRSPLDDVSSRYITKTDVTAYYEFVDHEVLADELLAQTGEEPLIDVLVQLLHRVMGRRVGLPQVSLMSDVLGDTYIDIVRRRMVRRGFNTFTYSDDFRIGTETLGGARTALEACATELRHLGLVLNERKTFTYGRPNYVESLDAFRDAERKLFHGTDALADEDYRDDDGGRLESENQMLSTEPIGGELDEADMLSDPEIEETPDDERIAAAVRAWARWADEDEDADVQSGLPAAITQSLLGHALPILGTAGEESPLINLSPLMRYEPALVPQVSSSLVAYAQHGKHHKAKVRDALDRIVVADVLSPWQSLWLAYTAGTLRGSRENRQHVRWLRTALEAAEPALAAYAAVALARLGHADSRQLAGLVNDIAPAWRPLAYFALALANHDLATSVADSELDRILLEQMTE
jgi:hypothetical protein